MVTQTRKSKGITKKAYDTYSSDSKIAVIQFAGYQFSLRSRWYPDLYQEYINRKDIPVDFSMVKTQQDMDALRIQFVKRYKDAPTQEQIDIAKQEFEIAYKNELDAFSLQSVAGAIIQDLASAGANSRISDARYKQIIEYIKDAVRAIADGKNINHIKESMPAMQRFLSKITFSNDTLSNFKHIVNEYSKSEFNVYNIPKASILKLLESLPTERITSPSSGDGGPVKTYRDVIDKIARKNMQISDKKYSDLAILLFKNKIKTDGLRTFDVLAKQHMDKLKKKETQIFKDASRAIEQKKGLAHQRVVRMYGPVDPVARSIAKGRKKELERK